MAYVRPTCREGESLSSEDEDVNNPKETAKEIDWKALKNGKPLTEDEMKDVDDFIHKECTRTINAEISSEKAKEIYDKIATYRFSPENRRKQANQTVMELIEKARPSKSSKKTKKAKDETADKPKQPEPIRNTEEERKQAIEILKGNPLKYIDDAQSKVIVGEECNRKALTLIRSTCYTDDPLSSRTLGTTAVGKSHLENNIALCFPPEDVYIKSRVTPTWIERTKDNLKHKILIVQQTSEGFSGKDALHVQLSEHETTLGTVDKQGEAVDIKVDSSISFGFTSTNYYVDSQMETRTVLISPDESEEQTARIIAKQKEYAYAPWEKGRDKASLLRIAKVMRWLRDEGVKKAVIPYILEVKVLPKKTTMRRVNPHIQDFIGIVAIINQLNRSIATMQDGTQCVLAQYEDAKYVFDNLEPILGKTVGELTETDKNVLIKMQHFELHSSKNKTGCWSYKDLIDKEIMGTLVFSSKTTAKTWLSRMTRDNFIEVTEQGGGKGKSNKYSVVSSTDEAKPFYTMKNSITPSVCETELKVWVDRYRDTDLKSTESPLSSDGTRKMML